MKDGNVNVTFVCEREWNEIGKIGKGKWKNTKKIGSMGNLKNVKFEIWII